MNKVRKSSKRAVRRVIVFAVGLAVFSVIAFVVGITWLTANSKGEQGAHETESALTAPKIARARPIRAEAPAVPEDISAKIRLESEEIAKALGGVCYDYGETPEQWKAAVEADCIAATQVVYYRAASEEPYFPDDVFGVLRQDGAFHGYDPDGEPTEFNRKIAAETLLALYGYGDRARLTVPEGTLYFSSGERGDYTNSYRTEYRGEAFLPEIPPLK